MGDESKEVMQAQPSLFAEDELLLLKLDEPETRKRYTAASLERNTAKREAICRAIAEGHGLLRIAKAFGVSHHLVSALRDARPDLVAIEKKQLSGQIGRILKLGADRFEEALAGGLVPVGQIPVAFGIFSDKKAALDGDPSLVIEHRHTVGGASVADFEARLAALKSAKTDIASRGNGANTQQKEDLIVIDVAADVAEAGGLGVVGGSPAQAGTVASGGGQSGEGGGRGSGISRGDCDNDGLAK